MIIFNVSEIPQYSLKFMAFDDNFNHTLNGIKLPNGLTSIVFGKCFNQDLSKIGIIIIY